MTSPRIMKTYRSWIPGIVFWTLFLISIGTARRSGWVDPVWKAAWMLFLIVIAIWSLVEMFHNRHATGGCVGYRGVPGWVVRLFGGDAN